MEGAGSRPGPLSRPGGSVAGVGFVEDGERIHLETVEEWRAWLAANHSRDDGVWLVGWRTPTGRPSVPYEEAVEEALCVGWIDATARTVDDERTMQWYAPRKPGSMWAATNKARVERLEREGRMTPAGRALVEQARADGSWTLLDAVERLEVPDDLAAALDDRPGAREHWDGSSASSRKLALTWLVQAKRPATRATRVETVVERCARGEKPGG